MPDISTRSISIYHKTKHVMKHIYIRDHMLSGTHIVRFNLKRNNIWWVTNNCPTRRPTWHGLKVHCLVEIWMKWCRLMQLSESPRRFTFQFQVFLVCHGCRMMSCLAQGRSCLNSGHAAVRWLWKMQIFVKTLTGKTITLETCCMWIPRSKFEISSWRYYLNLLEMFAQQSSAGVVVRHIQSYSTPFWKDLKGDPDTGLWFVWALDSLDPRTWVIHESHHPYNLGKL